MSGGHLGLDRVHGPHEGPLTRLDASVKLVCLVGFLAAVVATPAEAVWAFAAYAALVAGVVVGARLPARTLVRRLAIELPFVAFAVALPFVGSGPHREVLGLELSVPGLWGAWAILAKATIGVAATVVLAWTTPIAEILTGLERLHLPRALVAIAGFMVRYLGVVAGELHRLQVARVSRADDPRWLWQGRAVAATAGTVFVRSFERGERVHQAMLARGFTGRFPATAVAGPRRWFPAVAWPAAAVVVAVLALVGPLAP